LTLQTTPSGVRLCSVPVREIQNLHGPEYSWTNLDVSPGNNPLSKIRGEAFDLNASFTPGSARTVTFGFQDLSVVYDVSTGQISCNGKTNPLAPINGTVQLEILVDRDSIEIFGNHGQLYMPMPANNPIGNSLISLACTGGTADFSSLTVSKLESAWPQP